MAQVVDRAAELKQLQRDLEAAKVKRIQLEAARDNAIAARDEILAWFEDEGFDVKKSLAEQVEKLAEVAISDAEALLEAMNG
jgi:hypothetical protein